jgi:CHAT domain-containing protein
MRSSALASIFGSLEWTTRTPTQSSVASAADALREALPSEVREALDRLAPRSLVILHPSLEVEGIPWEWLKVGGALLCQRHAVCRQAPGISDRARGRPPVGRPLRALIVGDPQNPETNKLPGAWAEAQKVANLLAGPGGGRATLLRGPEATSSRVRQELAAGGYAVVHFTGHAWFDERESYLELHDGRVWASELGYLFGPRPPALLFLNSHFTSFVPSRLDARDLARPRASAPPMWPRSALRGFARLAARTGVGTFLGCFGSPLDEESKELACQLYASMLEGLSAAEALRRARNAVSPPKEWRALLRPSGSGLVAERTDVGWQRSTPLLFSLSGYPDLRLT